MAKAQDAESPTSVPSSGPSTGTLTLQVVDSDTRNPMTARVRVLDSDGKAYGEEIKGYGIITDNKWVMLKLPPGEYTVEASKRNDYEGVTKKVTVKEGRDSLCPIRLDRRLNLVEMGWLCGEGHTHQGRTEGDPKNEELFDLLRGYGEADGLNYVYMGQPHADFKGETAQQFNEYIATACGPDLRYRLGAEMPKTRFGHTWWFGLQKLDPPVESAMDTTHEDWYQAKLGWTPDDKKYPYKLDPPYELWHRCNVQGAVGVFAHPTSWWYEDSKDGNGKMFITNIAGWLPFDLLCERQIEAMAVLGYRDEHLFYQALWFELLNRGYRIPGVGESDGSLGKSFKNNFMAQRRVYAYAGPGGTEQDWLDAIRKGRSFMSSGPLVFATIDGNVAPGMELPADGKTISLVITAYADSVPTEFLSHIVVYRNGKVFAHKDYSDEKPRQLQWSVDITESEPAWYIVKAYGSHPPEKEEYFDVLPYVQQLLESGTDSPGDVGPIAITNPVYFAPAGYQPPAKIVPKYTVKVQDKAGNAIAKGDYAVKNFGRLIASGQFDNGVITGQWPATVTIEVKTAAGAGRVMTFYYYKPVADQMVYLRTGGFVKKYPKILPGQVPFEAFHFDELAQKLQNVEMTCVVK